jgi:CO/xanthine dehydrogenase FAD-binding subunit
MILDYFRPKSVEEALLLKKKYQNSVFVGGGSTISKRKDDIYIVDLQSLPLHEITKRENRIEIGALTSLDAIRDYFKQNKSIQIALQIEQSKNNRNQSTIGGFLHEAGSASPFLTCLMVMDCWVHLEPGNQKISLNEFLKIRNTKNQLITFVEIEEPKFLDFESIGRTALDKPIICCASSENYISFGGFGDLPFRIDQKNGPIDENKIFEELLITDDQWASNDYRKALISTLIKRMTEKRERQ